MFIFFATSANFAPHVTNIQTTTGSKLQRLLKLVVDNLSFETHF